MAVFNRLNNTICTRIEYSLQDSPYGRILMGTTPKGLCYFTFMDEETQPMENFEKYFKNHDRIETPQNPLHQEILKEFIREDKSDKKAYSLHVLGTDFQFAVWNEVAKIAPGKKSTYSEIANQLNKPLSVRAVGTAIGKNPIAYFIPCHRVVSKSGKSSGFKWGLELKKQLLQKEL